MAKVGRFTGEALTMLRIDGMLTPPEVGGIRDKKNKTASMLTSEPCCGPMM